MHFKDIDMRLATFNIAIKMDNTREIIDFLKSKNLDIITLQESMRALDEDVYKMFRSGQDIYKAFKPELLYQFFGPVFVGDVAYNGSEIALDFGGLAEQGNQIISRYKIEKAANKFYYNDYGHWFDVSNFRENDWARSVSEVVVDINGKKVQIFNLHGLINDEKMGNERTVKQCQFVIDEALKRNLPTIIVGDFNLCPESESIKLMNKYFRNLSTEFGVKTTRGPEKEPMVIDYIFVNEAVKVNGFEVIETDISDHLPLILDFEI